MKGLWLYFAIAAGLAFVGVEHAAPGPGRVRWLALAALLTVVTCVLLEAERGR